MPDKNQKEISEVVQEILDSPDPQASLERLISSIETEIPPSESNSPETIQHDRAEKFDEVKNPNASDNFPVPSDPKLKDKFYSPPTIPQDSIFSKFSIADIVRKKGDEYFGFSCLICHQLLYIRTVRFLFQHLSQKHGFKANDLSDSDFFLIYGQCRNRRNSED